MKLIFKGIVQGVGFRPTIYRIAKELDLFGYVLNKGSEVEVVIDKRYDDFLEKLFKNLPKIAQITDIKKETDNRIFHDFKILKSEDGNRESLIPPDVGICKDCINELTNREDRRYLFPFTNCTVCGARYSLINNVPYDRERTSMKDFILCNKCNKEYMDPLNRRYHAQTISCSDCGPKYKLYSKNKKLINNNIIKYFSNAIDSGKIGVIKSWGGMHICCRIDKISEFREWYKRPQKSFAIMVKNIKIAKKFGEITKYEEKQLLSDNKPIVLIKKKNNEEISPGLNTIGLYLPYTGLHHLLFSYMKSEALIMTSANFPGEPMIIDNNEVFKLSADIYLLHNRGIPNRIDDTVLRTWKNNIFFLRKSRGYIPVPINITYNKKIISWGAGENICGAISNDNKLFTTQYIGNSEYYSALEFLEKSIIHLMDLIMEKKEVDAITIDSHPGYNSRRLGENFSEKYSVPIYEIQHHWAHAASLLIDNKIDEGIILTLDGLGYGDDGNFWGGEILYSNFKSYERLGHLEYIPLLGGDKATKDPRRLVYAIFKNFGEEKYFKNQEANILNKLINKSPKTSSFGRFLDAVSCYLDICTKRTYNGEPAMKLEKFLEIGNANYSFNTKIKNNVVGTVDLFRQMDEIIKKPLTKKQKADISYSLVKSVIDNLFEIIIKKADNYNIKNIGLTGGVSYNIPIVKMIEKNTKKAGFNLVVHNRIPNGDGGIAVGQNVIVGNIIKND
jgi:hydrogenase maturation protein HypF